MSHERELIEMVEELCGNVRTLAPYHGGSVQKEAFRSTDEILKRLAEIKSAPKPGVVPAQMSARATIAMHAMAAQLASPLIQDSSPNEVSNWSVEYADALLDALGEK